MTDIRKCAQAVLDDSHGYGYVTPETLNMLEQALAEPVEPVALGWYRELCTEPVKYSFSFGAICPNIYDKWKPLYTTPPSVDALIGEIEGLDRLDYSDFGMVPCSNGDWIDFDELKAILGKYRSKL